MARQRGIADVLLSQLAEGIETGEQMEALGRALGFEAAAINRYTETNRMEGRVTCKGTSELLFKWRQTVKPCDQHLRLKQALIDAKLVMLAETHLKETPSIPDVYSKKISKSLTVQQCREKLENKYRHQLRKIQKKPWDQNDYANFKDMHTVVTMVKRNASGQEMKTKEILQGSVSDIFSTKVDGELPARILISAPAGRGKTTAVAKMAYDWIQREKGSALEHLPLLFVVKFRNTGVLTSIGEAIKSQLLSDVAELTPEGLESFIRENQGICHIILDGLDEYAGISSSNRSLGSNIVDVISWEEFPQCRVLVTTRPHLENFFNQAELPRVYTKMWIEGFSRESSRNYIDKFFASSSNPNSGREHGLKAYLDDQPLIDELVKTPLFCLMVCHLWSNGILDSGTTTQTELMDSVNNFLMQYKNARSESREETTPEMLRKILLKLGEVALTGLLDDAKKLVFTPHDFRRVPAILDMACELGIVSKTTVSSTCLPQSNKTNSTTIEFYHKIAQEHSAGIFLADQTYPFLLHFKMSKLDRVLRKINANIGDYENLIRFAAGTDNNLCIRIMEMLLTNSFLDESERYRILLDCSSETKNTEGNVSLLVRRCVNAESIVLKSPTVYTVVGMQNLPKKLKREVRILKVEGSTLTADVTSGLWSCLGSFPMLRTLFISDSSISFPSSPSDLPSVTKLSAERVTSHGCEGLFSSLSGLKVVDIYIDNAEREIGPITTSLRRTGGQTGIECSDEGDLVELVEWSLCLKALDSLHLQSRDGGCFEYDRTSGVQVKKFWLSTEQTTRVWSCLRCFTSLNHLTVSDSSLSFPPSSPKIPSVTKLLVERVTSQSYKGLLPLLPGLKDIDITIDDAERDIPHFMACLRGTGGQQLTHIKLTAPPSLPSEKNRVSKETMRELGLLIREQTKNLKRLYLRWVECTDEEDLIYLIECCRHVKSLKEMWLNNCGPREGGRLESHLQGLHSTWLHNELVVTLYHDGILVKQYNISLHYEREQSDQIPYFTRLGNEEFAGKTEKEMTRITETLLGDTDSTSPRPSASTSVAIPCQDVSAAVHESSTAEARALCIDQQHEEEDKYHSEGSFDQTGGELHIPSYGLNLFIPPGALPEGSGKAITLDVLTDIPPEITLRHDETLVTYGFQCLPSGLQFSSEKPARLTIPHCANLIDPTKVQVVLYSMNHEGGGDRIVQTSRTCKVTYNHVDIFLEHFSGGFLAFLKNAFFFKSKRMSFMPFLPKNMSQSKEMTLQIRMVNKPHGQSWRDVHDIGKEAVYQPAKDDDDEMNVKHKDMEVTCQLNDYDTLTTVVDASFIRKTKHTVYFDLDFIGKADELLVKLNVIQSKLPMEIHFRTQFLAHRVDIPTADAPTEANDVCTPSFRPTEKSREQDFDDLLRTVAKQIRKHVDIDNLGIELGFEPAEIICYIQMNEKYQTVTYMGTLSMLREWRNRTTRSEEREQLRKALIVLKHNRLVDDHLNDDITRITETSPGNTVSTSQRPSASTSVGIPPQGASAAAGEVSASQ